MMTNSLACVMKPGFSVNKNGSNSCATLSQVQISLVFLLFLLELGGNMVPFAGYELPVFYGGEHGGVKQEHLWCRADGKAALFDVSHMGQVNTKTKTCGE